MPNREPSAFLQSCALKLKASLAACSGIFYPGNQTQFTERIRPSANAKKPIEDDDHFWAKVKIPRRDDNHFLAKVKKSREDDDHFWAKVKIPRRDDDHFWAKVKKQLEEATKGKCKWLKMKVFSIFSSP